MGSQNEDFSLLRSSEKRTKIKMCECLGPSLRLIREVAPVEKKTVVLITKKRSCFYLNSEFSYLTEILKDSHLQ